MHRSRRLAPALADLPPALTRAVERLVRQPTDFHDVGDLAATARVTIRTAYRHLAVAGFTSPRALLVGARLLRAYAYARDPRQSLEAIAAKVGYSAPRMMAKHMREVIGVTPRAVRRQVRPWEFVDTLAAWLCPSPGLAPRTPAPRTPAPRTPAPGPPARIAHVAPLWDRTLHVLADAAPAPELARSIPGFDAPWPEHPSRPRLA
jgi:AraC-like DNA-binding protein